MRHVLVLVRHARAEAFGTTDHERALTDRGVREAMAAGSWLAGHGVVPDRVLVSDALRARQTWEALAGEAGWDLTPSFDSTLYEADPDTTLDVVRELAEDVTTAVLVGHNPTMAYLAQVLDASGSPQLAASGFPTGAVAVFDYDEEWRDLGEGAAQLAELHVERD
jgi:phosphohistidine phosphatase